MDKSLIRTEAEREARKALVTRNREHRRQLKVLQSLGLVCRNRKQNYLSHMIRLLFKLNRKYVSLLFLLDSFIKTTSLNA